VEERRGYMFDSKGGGSGKDLELDTENRDWEDFAVVPGPIINPKYYTLVNW